MSAYEIHTTNTSGILDWQYATFTTYSSYEPILGQDIDGDGSIGVNLKTLQI